MELCSVRGVANLYSPKPPHVASSHIQTFIPCTTRFPMLQKQTRFSSGSGYSSISCLRSTSDETTTETTFYVKDEPKYDPKSDPVVTVEETLPFEKEEVPVEKKEDYINRQNELPQEGSLGDNSLQLFKFLEDLDIKFDYEDKYSVFALGGGALVALWIASAVVGAVDSIPLFPKVLELVGLGYTVWFSTRYLIFKENRDELVARVEQLKQQIIGSEDD